jgi:hypothetical protein
MEIIIRNPKHLVLKHIATGKIYTFDEYTDVVKYDNEKFIKIEQNRLI